ncbi:MAG: permease [Actinobacteria bacterium]|nr:permease [Actinomycetota bacterium]
MSKNRRKSQMLIPTIIMGAIAIALILIGYFRGQGQHITGLKAALSMTIEILPLLIFAFIVAGMMQALIPNEIISKWIGEGSGLRGIFIGTVAGGIMPGGPYVSLPVAGGFLRTGASIGTMVAFLTGWSLWAIARLPMDIGILGWKFTFVRLACTFFFPPIAGLLANALFGKINY